MDQRAMRDIWHEMGEWTSAGRPFALARVIETWGSAPRAAGSGMIVGDDLRVAGSVSGGCIEGAVIEEAQAVLRSGSPKRVTYGVDDETAWSVGLSCGGEVSVFVETHPAVSEDAGARAVWAQLHSRLEANRPAVLLTRLEPRGLSSHLLVSPDGSAVGDWGEQTEGAVAAALEAYGQRTSGLKEVAGTPVFAHVFPRKDQLLIVGAGHISVALVRYAQVLDLETIVIDPRQVFAAPERFAVAPTQLHAKWPQEVLADLDLNEDTYTVLLTHDPKIDDPALQIFLRAPVAYIGALGGRKTQAARRERLRGEGFSDEGIGRIRGPVGLDIGAETAAEIALSIVGEVVEIKRSRSR